MSFNDLPIPTIFTTGYAKTPSPDTSTSNTTNQIPPSILLPSRPAPFHPFDSAQMPMAIAHVSRLPANLNLDADLAYSGAHSSPTTTGLVVPHSAVLRYVDLAPGYTCMMHRTRSLDYGIVLAGEAECVMDGGEVARMKPGDVCVQRYTRHAWRNPSDKEWARVVFVLMDCEELTVNGVSLGEDLGSGVGKVPGSGNDR